jgi:beta-propeller repeat-containing protein
MRSKQFAVTRGALAIFAFAVVIAIGNTPASASRIELRGGISPIASPGAASALTPNERRALDDYAKLPVAFIENAGQVDTRVRYYAQGNRFGFYFTQTEVVVVLTKAGVDPGVALALRFLGANANATIEGGDRVPGEVNYFRGSDPSQWHTRLARYGQVTYRDLWPGINLLVREQSGVLKYEFHVRPGARPSDIRLAYRGAEGLSVDRSGALAIDTAAGVVHDQAPVAFQEWNGTRNTVQIRYAPEGTGRSGHFGFAIDGAYDPDRELIVDPGIQYTTFLGGSSDDIGAGIAVDASGNAYIGGTTQSPDFPTTVGAFQRTGAVQNFAEAFVAKLNAQGSALVYATFLGGSDMEFGRRIAIDASGNAYITGQTKSSNFPTTANAFDRTLNIPANCPRCATDNTDGFVTKLNASGSALVYSTYLGGTDYDSPRGIAVDAGGNAYVMGETLSPDFPTTAGAFDRTYNTNYDIFVTKLNAAGSALTYSTFIGGTQVDNGERIAVDSGGNAYVMGFSSSTDFPTTPGAFDTTNNGGFDVTLSKLNPSGSALVYSTYLGGSGMDSGGGLVVNDAGEAYVCGGSGSLNFPTTAGAFNTPQDGSDNFVTKFNAAGSALVYSAVFGGTGSDGAAGIALDAAGNAWITGATGSTDYPTTANAADRSPNGGTDGFITELNPGGSALLYSTYHGGANTDNGTDVAVDNVGDVYVTGHTMSMDFPATVGAFDTVFAGDLSVFWGDAFITKIDVSATTNAPIAPPATPGTPVLQSPANASAPSQPIGFSWTNVTSAASYTIQIDDSSAFTAPLEREATVTSASFLASSLATTQHFWRVRGVNSAGVAGPWSAVFSFTPQPAPPPPVLSTIDTNPTSVNGGTSSTSTVVLSTSAPEGGALVSLSSSNPAVASVPATTTVPAFSFTSTVSITTATVSASTVVTITGTYNGSTRSANLTVNPPGSSDGTLSNFGTSPTSVTGGTSAQGFVVLAMAASTPTTVSLSSNNPGVASVPASVTVPVGSQSAVFDVATTGVSASTPVTLSATLNAITRTTTLTVTPGSTQPPPPPPPPPQSATLTVSVSGRSGQSVTSSPAGISVTTGSSGSASFNVGTSITLSVGGGRSAIWSGACSSGGSKRTSCTFTLNASGSVSANVQ